MYFTVNNYLYWTPVEGSTAFGQWLTLGTVKPQLSRKQCGKSSDWTHLALQKTVGYLPDVMISCDAPLPAKRFYHLSRFHTRISLTWLHFPCVCRSQIARGRHVRKRPDGQSGKWSNPWGNKVRNPSPLPQGPGEWGARQSRRQRSRRRYLQLSTELPKLRPEEHFRSLGNRKFKFPSCKLTLWNLIPPSLCSGNESSVLSLNWGLGATEPHNAILTPHTLLGDKVKYWGPRQEWCCMVQLRAQNEECMHHFCILFPGRCFSLLIMW